MSIPYLPLYVSDYEADTAHLTIEEDGAYMRLLRLCWRTPGCSIPDDPQWIARRLRVSMADYERLINPIIDEFFQREKARLFNPRLMREKARIEDTSRKRSDAGKKGGRPANAPKTNKKDESPDKANGKHLELELEPELEPEVKERTSNGFDAFWSSWPNKVSKAAAQKAWGKLKPSEREEAARLALSWFTAWRSRNRDASPIHPASYLNGKRWTDQILPPASTKHRTVPRPGGPMERPFKIVK